MGKRKSPTRVKPEPPSTPVNGYPTDNNYSMKASPPPEDAPTPSKKSRLNDSVASSSYNPMGFELETDHIVGIMDHCKLKLRDGEMPTFREHTYKKKKKIVSFKSPAAPEITFLNSNKPPVDDADEYCLAIFDRGARLLQYQPIDILNFEGHYQLDEDILKGKSAKKQEVDYTANNATDRDSLMAQRKELTAQFGSTKKNKMLDAAMRRNVNKDTLDNLSTSTFDSKNIVAKKSEKAADLTNLDGPTSTVLPPANLEAETPDQIYSLKFFYNEHTVEEDAAVAEKFFGQRNTVYKLSELEIYEYWGDLLLKRYKEATQVEKALLHKLVVMGRFIHFVFKGNSRYKIPFDHVAVDNDTAVYYKFVNEYFPNGIDKDRKIKFSTQDRDRVVAHFLCLWLLMNNLELPVTPLTNHFGINERVAAKTLTALGCIMVPATPAEIELYDTAKIARLTEVPSLKKKKGIPKRK